MNLSYSQLESISLNQIEGYLEDLVSVEVLLAVSAHVSVELVGFGGLEEVERRLNYDEGGRGYL